MSTSVSDNSTQNGEAARTESYFASPELSQRADLLRHLTENSNLIPLIRGVEGMGKSTFIQHLLDLAPENWIPVEIGADVMLQPDSLLANLASLFDQHGSGDRLIDDLVRHFEDLRNDGFLPVIIVDDAHLLPEATIIALLRLHERSTDELPLAQILLFADPEIDDLLKTPQLRVMNLQSLQILDMPEFTLDQTGLYLEHLLSSEEESSVPDLTSSQIERIYDDTGGMPGLIKEHAEKLIGKAEKSSPTPDKSSSLSGRTIIGGGLAGIALVLVLIYQDDINSIFSGDSELADSAQNVQIVTEGYKPLVIPESEIMDKPEQEAVIAESVDRDMPGDTEDVAGEQSDLGTVTTEDIEKQSDETKKVALKKQEQASEPEAIITQAEQPDVLPAQSKIVEKPASDSPVTTNTKDSTQAVPAEKKSTPVEKKLAKPQPIEGGVNKQEPKVSEAVSKTEPQTEPQTEPKVAQKKPDETKKPPKPVVQQTKKPEPPVKVTAKPAVSPARPVAKTQQKVEVKKAIKPVVASPPSMPEKKPQVMPAPVEERSTVLAKSESPSVKVVDTPKEQDTKQQATKATETIAATAKKARDMFYREAWLLKQMPSSYTIQLVGLQDEKGIADFIKRHSVDGPIAYYRTQRNGKPWFPVLYGAYSTRDRAVAARSKLPESLINSGAWLRTLGSVQKDIRAR
jgi:DamX protein